MGIYQHLTENEIRMMESSIDAHASETGSGHRTVSIEYILRFWKYNKEHLFHMFGDKLILEKEVEFFADRNELMIQMDKMMNDAGRPFYDDFYRTFVWDRAYDYLYCHLTELMRSASLVDNTYHGETFIVITPEGKEIKVVDGSKCTRVLSKLATAFHLKGFEEFRIAHSQVLNQKSMHGTLCLSIHPLDYVTMSDNASDWCSCMSWEDHGCYRRGTVEMMNSSMVVVGYLKGKNDMIMPNGDHWANKKWRELFIVNNDIISNVLGYPYRNDNLTKLCLNWLVDLAGKDAYTNEICQYDSWQYSHIDELDKEIYVDPCTDAMYNDFGSEQFAYFSKSASNRIDFCYSGESECMFCGELGDFEAEGYLVCNSCEPSYTCDECGDHYDADEIIEVDGVYLCSYCYDNYTCEDAITGENHLNRNMYEIHLAESKSKVFDDSINIYDYTYDNEDLTKYFAEVHEARRRWSTYYYVKIDEMTDEGLDLFGYDRESLKEMLESKPWSSDWTSEG